MSRHRNRLVVPQARDAVDQMKYEIANEAMNQSQGENLAEFSGSIGGEMTKRLVALGEQQLKNKNKGHIVSFINKVYI